MRERLSNDYKDGIYIGTIHGLANKFLVTHGINTGKLIEAQDFDKFFPLIKKNPHCVRHIRHILLDEAQDTSQEEFDFIFDINILLSNFIFDLIIFFLFLHLFICLHIYFSLQDRIRYFIQRKNFIS